MLQVVLMLAVWAFTTRPGLAPAGDSLSLASPRESKQREGDPQSGSLRCATGNLRCSTPAGVRRTRFAQTTAALIPPPSALLGPARTGWERVPNPKTNKDTPWRVLVDFGLRSSVLGLFVSNPFCLRRGAEVQTDQGSRLSERESASETPAGPSTAGCP